MTVEVIAEYEQQRNALWKKQWKCFIANDMQRYDRVGNELTKLVQEFTRVNGLNSKDSVEQQIADWRWNYNREVAAGRVPGAVGEEVR